MILAKVISSSLNVFSLSTGYHKLYLDKIKGHSGTNRNFQTHNDPIKLDRKKHHHKAQNTRISTYEQNKYPYGELTFRGWSPFFVLMVIFNIYYVLELRAKEKKRKQKNRREKEQLM